MKSVKTTFFGYSTTFFLFYALDVYAKRVSESHSRTMEMNMWWIVQREFEQKPHKLDKCVFGIAKKNSFNSTEMFQFTIKSIDANIDEQMPICTRAHTHTFTRKESTEKKHDHVDSTINYNQLQFEYRIRRTLIRVQMEMNAIRIGSSISFVKELSVKNWIDEHLLIHHQINVDNSQWQTFTLALNIVAKVSWRP